MFRFPVGSSLETKLSALLPRPVTPCVRLRLPVVDPSEPSRSPNRAPCRLRPETRAPDLPSSSISLSLLTALHADPAPPTRSTQVKFNNVYTRVTRTEDSNCDPPSVWPRLPWGPPCIAGNDLALTWLPIPLRIRRLCTPLSTPLDRVPCVTC